MTGNERPLAVAQMLETDGPGGAELVVYHLSTELRDRGATVHPVGPSDGEGWLGEKFRASGFETETFTLRRPLDWRLLRELVVLLRRLHVDVVHSHEFTMCVYGAAAARFAGVPHVVTMHGNETVAEALRRRIALRWAFRHSGAVIAVSRATKAQLDRDLRLDPGVIDVVPNGMPVRAGNAEPILRELGSKEGEVLIVAVGNLDPRKGHRFLLEALQQLADQGLEVPWRVAIAGGRGGPEKPRLEAFAAEHGFSDRLHILSRRDDVPDLLAAADVFAMPSLWEGLPLAVLEAMLAGTAIVASDISGIPEAIVTDEHGILVPPGDVPALARALGRLLAEPALRERLGSAAQARAQREFTLAAMTDRYDEIYRTVIAGD